MTAADKAIRWSTVAAVVVVAAVAASFSYQHALDVIGRNSRPSRLNVIYPVAIDGLIYAASMTLLNDARRDQLRKTLPARRVIGPADIAALAVHIMTNTAITGATYDIDGGQQLVPSQ
jgi:Protein of unknown function (DUF2637)